MQLSPLQIKFYIAIALFAALVVFELITRLDDHRKLRSGQAEDQRVHDTALVKHNAIQYPKWRVWSEGLLIIATGAAMIVAMISMMEYQKYGAFYDASWRDPSVESHFEFLSTSNQKLESQWQSDPDNYNWYGHNLVIVKLGCDDCERVADTIHELESNGYDIVFSTSPLGKAYVEKFNITYVPSAIVGSAVVQLRSGSSSFPVEDAGDQTHGEITQGILDSLLDGVDTDAPREPIQGGTVAEIQGMEDEKNAAKAEEPGQEDPEPSEDDK